MMPRTVVIIRTAPFDQDTQTLLTSLGYTPLVEPILEIETLKAEYDGLQAGQGIIITSIHALDIFQKSHTTRDYNLYVVGSRVEKAAQEAGFTSIKGVFQTVQDLVDTLKEIRPSIPLTYLRGVDISLDVKAALPFSINEITVYKAIPAEQLSLSLLNALDRRDVAATLFYSARGAQNFADLIQQYDRTLRLKETKALCLADSMVKSLSVLPFSSVQVAKAPDRENMLTLIEGVLPPLSGARTP
jgi:uroporphyrinogen-III synthase